MEMWIFVSISYHRLHCSLSKHTLKYSSYVNKNIHSKAFDDSLHLLWFQIWHWNQIWMLFWFYLRIFFKAFSLDWNLFRFSKYDAENGISVVISNSNRYAFMNILLSSNYKNWMTTFCDGEKEEKQNSTLSENSFHPHCVLTHSRYIRIVSLWWWFIRNYAICIVIPILFLCFLLLFLCFIWRKCMIWYQNFQKSIQCHKEIHN